MAVNLAPGAFGAGYQAFTSGGLPLNGGLINTYLAGTSTPVATYTSSTGLVQNANPIVLNSDGRQPNEIWVTSGYAYKFVLTDSLSNIIQTFDNLIGINDTSGLNLSGSEWLSSGLTPTYISATSFSVSGNQTAILQVGRRLQTTNTGGTIYSTIVASSFGAGITTVTVVNDSGTLDSGLSVVNYGILSASNPSIPIETYLYSVAGTNTITAVGAIVNYHLNQEFVFIPAATNTGATTLNVNGLGAKNVYFGNAACVGGELMINVPVKIFYDGTQFQIITPALRSKIITFTRNLTTATGNVSYTGVGFQPTSIILFGGINANGIATYIGFSDSGRYAADLYLDSTATSTVGTAGGGAIIITTTATTAFQEATLLSYDADGFTLSWTKTNLPTGTVTYYALCLR